MKKGNTIPVEVDFKINNIIFNYVKDKKNNNKIGIVLACRFKSDNRVYIGYSLCNKVDKFDKKTGFELALLNAYKNKLNNIYINNINIIDDIIQIPENIDYPKSIKNNIIYLLKRCIKFYKFKIENDKLNPLNILLDESVQNSWLFNNTDFSVFVANLKKI